jgi:hypothetical protein
MLWRAWRCQTVKECRQGCSQITANVKPTPVKSSCKLGTVVHACNPSTQEVKTDGS